MFLICALVIVFSFILLFPLSWIFGPECDDTSCCFSGKKMLNLSLVRVILTESFTPGLISPKGSCERTAAQASSLQIGVHSPLAQWIYGVKKDNIDSSVFFLAHIFNFIFSNVIFYYTDVLI